MWFAEAVAVLIGVALGQLMWLRVVRPYNRWAERKIAKWLGIELDADGRPVKYGKR